MKLIGQILLWCGFLSGALATVINPASDGVEFARSVDPAEIGVPIPELGGGEIREDGWHLIPWFWYGASALVCVVGVVVIRASLQSERIEKIHRQRNHSRTVRRVGTGDRPGQGNPQETGYRTTVQDRRHARRRSSQISYVSLPINAKRSPTQFGLAAFADVMTAFASGERSINRAWSASADGYFDEAESCLERGIAMLGKRPLGTETTDGPDRRSDLITDTA